MPSPKNTLVNNTAFGEGIGNVAGIGNVGGVSIISMPTTTLVVGAIGLMFISGVVVYFCSNFVLKKELSLHRASVSKYERDSAQNMEELNQITANYKEQHAAFFEQTRELFKIKLEIISKKYQEVEETTLAKYKIAWSNVKKLSEQGSDVYFHELYSKVNKLISNIKEAGQNKGNDWLDIVNGSADCFKNLLKLLKKWEDLLIIAQNKLDAEPKSKVAEKIWVKYSVVLDKGQNWAIRDKPNYYDNVAENLTQLYYHMIKAGITEENSNWLRIVNEGNEGMRSILKVNEKLRNTGPMPTMTSVLEHFDIVHTNYGCYLIRV